MDWGVDTIFGIPGDGINGIIEVAADAARTRFASFRSATRRPRRSRPAPTPNRPASSASASPPRVPAASICSTGFTTPSGRPAGAGHHRPQFHDLIDTFTQQDVELDKLLHGRLPSTTRGSWGRPMSRTSSNLPAAPRSPIAASRTSPCRSISSRCRSESARSRRNVAAPRLRGDGAFEPRCRARINLRARRRNPQFRQKNRHPRRPRRARRGQELRAASRAARRADRQAAARQGGACPTTARIASAASAFSARGRPRTRWRAATRC